MQIYKNHESIPLLIGFSAMKKEVRDLAILLIVIFILYNFIIFFITSGCPPAFAVEKIKYDPNLPSTRPIAGIHVTDQELLKHPFLKEVFEYKRMILLPVGTITDLIPGNIFGPEYTVNRMSLWERKHFEDTIFVQQNTIWEHNGTYIKFYTVAC